MSRPRKHSPSSQNHDNGQAPARPKRKNRVTQSINNFYAPPASRKPLPAIGRRTSSLYDEHGRKRSRQDTAAPGDDTPNAA